MALLHGTCLTCCSRKLPRALSGQQFCHCWLSLRQRGERAFSIAASKLQKDLPLHIRQADSFLLFESSLKTLLFGFNPSLRCQFLLSSLFYDFNLISNSSCFVLSVYPLISTCVCMYNTLGCILYICCMHALPWGCLSTWPWAELGSTKGSVLLQGGASWPPRLYWLLQGFQVMDSVKHLETISLTVNDAI